MDSDIRQDWRRLLRAHIQAKWDDVRAHLEAAFSNAEARFIKEHGSDSMQSGHNSSAKAIRDSLLPPPPEECYEVIEESVHRVLAQVRGPDRQPNSLHFPGQTTRFLLTQGVAGWRIEAIYSPCICCNLGVGDPKAPCHEPGKCFFCCGTGLDCGSKTVIHGFWPFRRQRLERDVCKHRDGTGACLACKGEDVPGWQSVFSIDGVGRAWTESTPAE